MKTIDPKYSHAELPRAKNPLLHFYKCFMKIFCIFFFGTGGFLLGLLVFPVFKIIFIKRKTFKKAAMAFTSATFRFFIVIMRLTGCLRLKIEGREKLKELKSCIIVANHPSLLDVVFLISIIKNADCIVRGGLTKTPLVFVIKHLYIVNTLGTEEMMELSKASLDTGTNLIIFPEGTRTPRHGLNPYKRGAARIALRTKSDIVPVYIGGNDKYGLGKHDPLFSFNPTEIYRYHIKVLDKIPISDFADEEEQIAARHLTDRIHTQIAEAALKTDGKIL
ncbi:MAG: 1-acyl-sn-glycerol-3-phosphate acyltransferase [Treponema sp.]|nr:1-acyl-sn-glycerol-3-phosphate acyltransferase [Treponema sp.]